jgi:hypothetical protein
MDAATSARIRDFEASEEQPKHLRWRILIDRGFGALMPARPIHLGIKKDGVLTPLATD